MQYYDDMIELIEDLPEEMTRRSNQLKLWDVEVTRLQRESKDLQRRLFEDKTLSEEADRERLAAEIGEKQHQMRSITNKKVDLAERSERLMQSVLDKVNNGAFHFRCELEADNPGCVENLERNFYDSVMDVRPLSEIYPAEHYKMSTSGRNSPAVRSLDSYSMSSKDSDRDSLAGGNRAPKKTLLKRLEKNRLLNRPSSSSDLPSKLTALQENNKYPMVRDKNGKIGVMSRYKRKKQERLREEQKMIENAIRREQEQKERKKKRMEAQVPQLDLNNFCAQATASTSLARDMSMTPSSLLDTEDNISWAGAGEEEKVLSDLDDDLDLSDDLLNLFPDDLPSPPRDIMESLDDDSMFGLAAGDLFDDDPGPLDFPDPYIHRPVINAPEPIRSKFKSGKGSGESSNAEKKKKNAVFSSYSDTSLHGRPIKLTGRAAEMIEQNREREKKKKDDDEEVWCTCREGSSGLMIECESGHCPIGWFHVVCVGLAEAPDGSWICPSCRQIGERKAHFL